MEENKEKEIFLNKISKVVDYMHSVNIPSIDKALRNTDGLFNNIFLFDSSGPTSFEIIIDKQNIPKWWRSVYNWGASISFSFSWACAWLKLLDEKRQALTKENSSSNFNEFVKSEYFDGEAWFCAKYYLDNAIIRLYSYREKLTWMLNSHSKLCLLSEEEDKISFWKYYEKAKKSIAQDYEAIVDILSENFTSPKINEIIKHYRHDFIHNDTPIVDWPKEQQATVIKKYDKNNRLVSMEVPLYGLQPPDFEIDTLMEDTLYVWGQFVEGTNKIYELLNESYYQGIQENTENEK
ncbi:MAG: Cthe_2314 family HEPN domain-containing protein [Thermodesulfovibrionales bacterium]